MSAGTHSELTGAAVGTAGVFGGKLQTAADGGLVVALPLGGGFLDGKRPGELPAVPGQHLGADAVGSVMFGAFRKDYSGFFNGHLSHLFLFISQIAQNGMFSSLAYCSA